MAKQRTLTPSFLVRVQVPQLDKRLTKVGRFSFKPRGTRPDRFTNGRYPLCGWIGKRL